MGSSVFHGGISTLIAVSLLGFSDLYTFRTFWKTWTAMLIFGLLNGMILNPIILSIAGPLDVDQPKKDKNIMVKVRQ